jgi:hypothetical protein
MARKNPWKKGGGSSPAIPKGKKKGDTFTRGGVTYKVVSYTIKKGPRKGKRVRYARAWDYGSREEIFAEVLGVRGINPGRKQHIKQQWKSAFNTAEQLHDMGMTVSEALRYAAREAGMSKAEMYHFMQWAKTHSNPRKRRR